MTTMTSATRVLLALATSFLATRAAQLRAGNSTTAKQLISGPADIVVVAQAASKTAASHVAVATSQTSASARSTTASENFGKKTCPCIGIGGTKGEMTVFHKTNHTYPAETGSSCEAWDDDRHGVHCKEGQKPGKGEGWCAASWCFVDPCNCEGVDPPKKSTFLPEAAHRGLPVYFSYATCGAEDTWSKDHNPEACPNVKTEDKCALMEQCLWDEKKGCVGWEIGGLCGMPPDAKEWGAEDCLCANIHGSFGTLDITINNETHKYPADLGSTCQNWDEAYSPHCKEDPKTPGCDQKWCYVDPANCHKRYGPAPSYFLPHARYQGRRLHYSYETCGGKEPPKVLPSKAQLAHEEHKEQLKEETKAEAPKTIRNGPPGDGLTADWHNEYEHGDFPTWRKMQPKLKGYEDAQSDGKPGQ